MNSTRKKLRIHNCHCVGSQLPIDYTGRVENYVGDSLLAVHGHQILKWDGSHIEFE